MAVDAVPPVDDVGVANAKKKLTTRLVSLTVVGAVAGSAGENILREVPTSWLVGAALAAGVTVFRLRSRWRPETADSVSLVLIVAASGAVATALASRYVGQLSRDGKLVVLAGVVALLVGILLYVLRRSRAARVLRENPPPVG